MSIVDLGNEIIKDTFLDLSDSSLSDKSIFTDKEKNVKDDPFFKDMVSFTLSNLIK